MVQKDELQECASVMKYKIVDHDESDMLIIKGFVLSVGGCEFHRILQSMLGTSRQSYQVGRRARQRISGTSSGV